MPLSFFISNLPKFNFCLDHLLTEIFSPNFTTTRHNTVSSSKRSDI
jgi:hypothetical protein